MKHVFIIGLALLFLASGCAHYGHFKTYPSDLPVVVMEYANGNEVWGRLLSMEDDSLAIRNMDDMQPRHVNPQDIVAVYIVEAEPAKYPLAILTGLAIMGGSLGVVMEINDGEVSSGSMILAGVVGIIPATFAAVKVADWTRGYQIIPLRVQGSDGMLDLSLLRRVVANYVRNQ